ncbi:MAG: PhzF family phenazine biosynthesis protein [Flavobacteriaceae bacterium]|nr:PhzF family phenazine biosynthesis protein [Flavobacteriaceae bacterium]
MVIEIYQIDAFTNTLFGGNPAAVCPLEKWLPDHTLLNIAKENNLAETAFFIKLSNGNYHLRWFTPRIEMDLCGHATLATAYVLFQYLGYTDDRILFETLSGLLEVKRDGQYLEMDFPSRPAVKAELPEIIKNSLNIQPREVYKDRDYLLVYDNENEVKKVQPNQEMLSRINLDPGGIIVTARGDQVDFVSRFFTPQAPIFEDPVTGSAHCTLTPFWSEKLNKKELHALQISERRGELFCRLENNRVFIKGSAINYLKGQITI